MANCVYEFVYDGAYYRVIGDIYPTGVKGASLQDVMIGNADAPYKRNVTPVGDQFAFMSITDSPIIWFHLAKSSSNGSAYATYQMTSVAFNGRIYGDSKTRPSLGEAYQLWDTIYLASSPSVTSDRNAKNDIEPLSDCSQLISGLKPVSFKYNDGSSGRTHYGLIAQDVEELLATLGIDFGGFIKSPVYKKRQETFTSLKSEVENLKQEVSALLSTHEGGSA